VINAQPFDARLSQQLQKNAATAAHIQDAAGVAKKIHETALNLAYDSFAAPKLIEAGRLHLISDCTVRFAFQRLMVLIPEPDGHATQSRK
jgi:hypothetical protein